MYYLQAMEARLSERDKRRLQRVYAPQVVGTQPSNTWSDLCVMPDGEIRYYGHDDEGRFYLSSTDCGLTWNRRDVDDLSLMTAAVLNPQTGRWFSSFHIRGEGGWHNCELPAVPEGLDDWQAVLSDEGPGSPCRWVKVSGGNFVPRVPYVLSSGRVLIACQIPARQPDVKQHPVIARSDDNGETWALTELKPAPPHVPGGLHESVRWQNGSCEPTIVERSDGSVLLIARTSQDVHYQYESFDGGETWSDPQPTTLHGTLTMPTLLRLSSGALLFFFCNTEPLHEIDKTKVWPPLSQSEMTGASEDVFTNRDANHAAISFDDGRTWHGFRELLLNPLRNSADFRTSGANLSLDKSVHQFQAIELPFGKVLLCCGQHAYVRRMIVFDPKWLMECERSEDFRCGLENVSTHVYLKSRSGNKRPNWNGHCAWNRTDGAVMLPDPDGNFEEAVYVCTRDDDRLYSPMQGVVWNFPAAKRGNLALRLMVLEDGLTLTLSDRWFNPIDPHAAVCAQFTCAADDALCPVGQWADVTLAWDETGCDFAVNGTLVSRLAPQSDAPNGLCYLIAQSAPDYTGRKGAYIKCLSMKARSKALPMRIETIRLPAFSVIGLEGSTRDGEGFIQRLWAEANARFAEVQPFARTDESGRPVAIWGLMSDFSRSFLPWTDNFTQGLYLAGVECPSDALPPDGWTKWTVPAFEYLRAGCEDGLFPKMLVYLSENDLTLAGAVHDFTDPADGKSYMLFPIRRL